MSTPVRDSAIVVVSHSQPTTDCHCSTHRTALPSLVTAPGDVASSRVVRSRSIDDVV